MSENFSLDSSVLWQKIQLLYLCVQPPSPWLAATFFQGQRYRFRPAAICLEESLGPCSCTNLGKGTIKAGKQTI